MASRAPSTFLVRLTLGVTDETEADGLGDWPSVEAVFSGWTRACLWNSQTFVFQSSTRPDALSLWHQHRVRNTASSKISSTAWPCRSNRVPKFNKRAASVRRSRPMGFRQRHLVDFACPWQCMRSLSGSPMISQSSGEELF